MKLYDTKLVIEMIKNNANIKIAVCDVTLFEMMKNKTRKCAKKQFEHFYHYIKRTNSIFLTHLDNANISNLSLSEALKVGRRLKKIIIEKLIDYIYEIFAIVFMLNMLFLSKDYKKIERINNIENNISNVRNALRDLFYGESRKELANYIKSNKSETIENELLVSIYNYFSGKINLLSKDKKIHLKRIKYFSTNEMISGTDKCTIKKYIEQFVDDVMEFKENPSITKTFYKTYLVYLYTEKMKIEINDFVDMNIAFGGYSEGFEVATTDTNFYKMYNSITEVTLEKL